MATRKNARNTASIAPAIEQEINTMNTELTNNASIDQTIAQENTMTEITARIADLNTNIAAVEAEIAALNTSNIMGKRASNLLSRITFTRDVDPKAQGRFAASRQSMIQLGRLLADIDANYIQSVVQFRPDFFRVVYNDPTKNMAEPQSGSQTVVRRTPNSVNAYAVYVQLFVEGVLTTTWNHIYRRGSKRAEGLAPAVLSDAQRIRSAKDGFRALPESYFPYYESSVSDAMQVQDVLSKHAWAVVAASFQSINAYGMDPDQAMELVMLAYASETNFLATGERHSNVAEFEPIEFSFE